jgi:hypothetical protein
VVRWELALEPAKIGKMNFAWKKILLDVQTTIQLVDFGGIGSVSELKLEVEQADHAISDPTWKGSESSELQQLSAVSLSEVKFNLYNFNLSLTLSSLSSGSPLPGPGPLKNLKYQDKFKLPLRRIQGLGH